MSDPAMSVDWQQLMAKLLMSPSSLTPQEVAILKTTPAIAPPPGVVPNFVNPPTIKRYQYGVTSTLLALMSLVFFNRVYVKTFLMKKYGWDDLTLLLSFMGTIVYYAVAIWGTRKPFASASPASLYTTNSRPPASPSTVMSSSALPATWLLALTLIGLLVLLGWLNRLVNFSWIEEAAK